MLRSFKIGKLFGIPLYVHTTFFLLPVWLLLTNGGFSLANVLFFSIWIVGVFSCVVLHELGHALMARHFGIGTSSITLYPIGGVARLLRMSDKPFEEICIALAGPAVNLVLAVLLAPLAFLALLSGLHPDSAVISSEASLAATVIQFALLLCAANVGLLVFNLLPCFPMDGGRVFRALLALWKGQLKATEIAVRVGLVMACLIAALCIPLQSPMPLVLAAFVYFAGQMEWMGLRQREAQRRAALIIPPILQPEFSAIPFEEPPQSQVPFTGIAWDGRTGVWVRWHNGQPVAYWS